MNKMVDLVTKYYGVTIEDVKNKIAPHASDMLCYMLRKHSDMKISEIGKVAGKPDHVTVVISINRIEEKMKDSIDIQKEVAELEELLNETEKIKFSEKLFDLLTLDTVDDFTPRYIKKISVKVEILIRVVLWMLTVWITYCCGDINQSNVNLLFITSGVITVEFLWSGFKQFSYLQDVVLHSLSIVVFMIASFGFYNHLLGLAIMGIAKCFSDFEYKNLHCMKEYNREILEEWEGFLTRRFKFAFLSLTIVVFVVSKSFAII